MRLVFIYLEEGIIKEVIPNNCSNVILFWFSHIFFNPFFVLLSGIIVCAEKCFLMSVFICSLAFDYCGPRSDFLFITSPTLSHTHTNTHAHTGILSRSI